MLVYSSPIEYSLNLAGEVSLTLAQSFLMTFPSDSNASTKLDTKLKLTMRMSECAIDLAKDVYEGEIVTII